MSDRVDHDAFHAMHNLHRLTKGEWKKINEALSQLQKRIEQLERTINERSNSSRNRS